MDDLVYPTAKDKDILPAKVNILGVKVSLVDMDQAVRLISSWLMSSLRRKYYVVTPNVEFVLESRKDERFKEILNSADLAIPDSARFKWAYYELNQKNPLLKLLFWKFFLVPFLVPGPKFPVTTGTDLLAELVKKSQSLGFTIGFLGGSKDAAKRAAKRFQIQYPGSHIIFADAGPKVNREGLVMGNWKADLPEVDLLFVGFGQVKQEKWIVSNLGQLPVKVAIGVGGAFDYYSGDVFRAPRLVRRLGFEWLFRLIIQPWRIKRWGSLVKFVFLVLFNRTPLS